MARVKEDEIRNMINVPEEVVQQRKERKISREFNATMAHGNALDARAKEISELKWLFELEDDDSKKRVILSKIKEIILVDPPVGKLSPQAIAGMQIRIYARLTEEIL